LPQRVSSGAHRPVDVGRGSVGNLVPGLAAGRVDAFEVATVGRLNKFAVDVELVALHGCERH
jgi:hypothetical protein